MKSVDVTWKRFTSMMFGLWLGLGAPGAPAWALTIAPVNPSIPVGQTQQFTASGALTPAAVAAGGFHACMVLSDQTVECWGRNNFGQLGNGTLTSSSVPVQVSGLTTAIDVATGNEHTCALLADGTVRCWGVGDSGQLGDGTTTTFSTVPVAVSGLSGAVAIVAGGFHSCAVLGDGSVRCWGRNIDGQLGHGTNTNSSVPGPVIGLGSVVELTAGGYHTCARGTDGSLRCWGRNDDGQLGNGTRTSSSIPVEVAGIAGPTAITGGGFHTCALLPDGTVHCWGRNEFGQTGQGTAPVSTTPALVSGVSGAVAVSAGGYHSCALLPDETLRCWGRNDFGQLGDGSTTSSSTPVAVGGISSAAAVTGGALHTCAHLADGAVRCWGAGDFGQLGNGTTAHSSMPVMVAGTGGITWTSSNTTVATVDAAGLATAHSGGTTTITATDGSGESASTTLTVIDRVTLSVVRQGMGSGTVTSNPSGIACGSDCSEPYDSGTRVTLTAAPAAGSTFTGWTGCDSMSGTTCTVTMSASRSVTATFNVQAFALTVTRAGSGTGTVSSSPAGIECGADCSEPYDSGTVVTLTAAPASGSTFVGWSGCDTVSGTTCSVTMNAARSITATFNTQAFTLTVAKAGSGAGIVSSSPAGINCGSDCSEPYASGTMVTLTAAPASGSTFAGWSGCNAVSGATCSVTMNAARSVTATFDRQRFTLTVTVSETLLGTGTVTSSPQGIHCGSDCSEAYIVGTTVTLTATPAFGSLFTGWSGCDSVSGSTCTVNMSRARSVTARFTGLSLL